MRVTGTAVDEVESRSQSAGGYVAIVAVLLPVAAVVFAAARLAAGHWVPLTDDAVISLRSHDVFSRHVPLVGMPSTLALYTAGHGASHPGPLEFFVLAIPYAVFHGSPAALLAGVAAINIAAIAAIGWGAWRLGGSLACVLAMLLVGALMSALGGSMTVDVWNPAVAVLPFAAFLVLSVCIARGDIVVLPAVLVAGSFAAQAHLGYLAPVGVTAVWVIACLVAAARRRRRLDPSDDHARPRRRLIWIVSALVFVACWWAPIAQQLFARGGGNIAAILDAGRSARLPAAGFGFAVQIVGRVVGLPPPFGLPPVNHGASAVGSPTLTDVARFVVPWVVTAVFGIVAWRRRNTLALSCMAAAGLAVAAGVVTAMRAPVLGASGLVLVYNVWFLWPIAMFFWFMVAFVAVLLFVPAARVRRNVSLSIEVACVIALVAMMVASAPASPDDPAMRLTRDLTARLAAQVKAPGPYVIRTEGGSGGSVVSVPVAVASGVAAAIERRGIDTYEFPALQVSKATWEHRFYNGQRARGTMWITNGDSPPPSPTARLVAASTAMTADQRSLEQHLFDELRASIAERAPQLTPKGLRVLGGRAEDSARDVQMQLSAALHDPVAALGDGSLAALVDAKLMSVSKADADMLHRYARLHALSAWAANVYIDGPPE